MSIAPHVFEADLIGGCQACPHDEADPVHVRPAPAVVPMTAPNPFDFDSEVSEGWTLREVKAWLHANADEGVHCPACAQNVKVYSKRRITSTMARNLITVARQAPNGEWFHLPTAVGSAATGDTAKLRWWGLMEAAVGIRDDGSNRVGWWRVTPDGYAYVRDQLRVPKFAVSYNNVLYGMWGESVGIQHALGTKFDYRDLMGTE